MEKIAEKTVTDTLAKAMENADRIKHLVIVYETVDGEKQTHGIMSDDSLTLAGMNFLFDVGKKWIFE